MADRDDVKRTATDPRYSHTRFGWAALLLSVVLLALQMGCREESANVQGPSMQAEPAKAVQAEAETVSQGPQTTEPDAVKAPKIVLEKTTHDFGEIGPGTAQSTKFRFKNEGTAPLRISQVRSCCGVVTKGVKAGQVYAPGQSGVLSIDYRASMQPGSMKRNLYIQSNDPLHGVATLTIRAVIVPRVAYTPARLKLFTNQENAGAPDITLTSLDGKPFAIKGFRATAKALTADFDPVVEATEFVLKPKADMQKLERNLRGQISIDLTHPECKNVRLLYDVLSEFTVDREQIMLFNLAAGQAVQREIWVLSNYQKEFEIEAVSSQKGAVTLLEKKKVGSRYQLKLQITPPAVESERAVMSDVVEVKIVGGPTLSIQCRGFYQGK